MNRTRTHSEGADRPLPPAVRRRLQAALERLAADQTGAAERRRIEQSLVQWGPSLLDALAALVRESDRRLPAVVYHEVLPRIDATFERIGRLESPEIATRRQAASGLARQVEQKQLGDLALRRLETLVIPEPDANVWWNIEIALADDHRPAATRIHLAALSHPAPEIRRRACQYLAGLGDPRHLTALLATLDDSDPAVVQAAVEAIGVIGRTIARGPSRHQGDRGGPWPGTQQTLHPVGDGIRWALRGRLEPLLASDDAVLRLAAARALAELGWASGTTALERLAYHGNPTIRRRAAETMAQLRDPAFTPTLIHLLDDRLAVRKAALAGLERIHGADAAGATSPRSAGAPRTAPGLNAEIDRWKRWYTGGMPAVGAALRTCRGNGGRSGPHAVESRRATAHGTP